MEKPSGGFDMANMSMASKIVLVGGILLLVDSFLVLAEGLRVRHRRRRWAVFRTSARRRTRGAAAAASPASSWASS